MALQRILYVEDEPDIRSVAMLALEAVGGLEVCACADGYAALEKAAGSGAQLLLLDVMMPGLDGVETLRKLRQIPEVATCPAVFMTAKVQPAEVAHLREMGAADVVAKPFDPMTLAAKLREIYDRSVGEAA